MKRSEMIQLMIKELNSNCLESDAEIKSAMEHVLGILEENGMLPPSSEKEYKKSGYSFRWEDENGNDS